MESQYAWEKNINFYLDFSACKVIGVSCKKFRIQDRNSWVTYFCHHHADSRKKNEHQKFINVFPIIMLSFFTFVSYTRKM